MDDSKEPRVIYEGEDLKRPIQINTSQTPRIIRWVMKSSLGYIKDEKQANYILLFFVLIIMVFSLFLFFREKQPYQKPSLKNTLQIEQMPINR